MRTKGELSTRAWMRPLAWRMAAVFMSTALLGTAIAASIPAAHVYHNHMPNFWPFYGVDVAATYDNTAIGAPIRYTYDGQVINLKNNPPPGYSYYRHPEKDLGSARLRR